jgi:circadian clock protein KaiC
VVLLRPYEFSGHVRKSLSVYNHRTGPHESTIRDLKIGATGLQIGPPLTRFQGVLSGQPVLMGGRGADPV